MLAHLSGTICLKHSATLILPPFLKPPSRRTCLIIISELFFTTVPIPSSDTECVCVRACVRACVCVCGYVIVKRPVLPPCVVDERSRNPLYCCYYYYYLLVLRLARTAAVCLISSCFRLRGLSTEWPSHPAGCVLHQTDPGPSPFPRLLRLPPRHWPAQDQDPASRR